MERRGDHYRTGPLFGTHLALPDDPLISKVQVRLTPFLSVLYEQTPENCQLPARGAPLELERATIIGNSMGGGTTLRFGYEHPERVHRLITMGSSSGSPTLMGPAGLTEGLKVLQQGYRQPSSKP